MGGFLKVVGVIALILVALVVALFVWAILTAGPILKSATAYIDDAVPAIAKAWDREELLKRMTPELRATMTPEGLDTVYSLFTSFGPLVKYNGVTNCSAGTTMNTSSGRTIWANCAATAKCENADVLFQVGLVQMEKSWAIQSFFAAKVVSSAPATSGMSFGFGSTRPPGLTLPIGWLARVTTQPAKPD